MQFNTLLFIFFWILITSIPAAPVPDKGSNTQDVEIPSIPNSIADHPIWAQILEIGQNSSKKDTDILNIIKGTFLDPEIIITTHSSSDPIAQDVTCNTSAASPLYSDALYLVSITINRSDGDVYNPGSRCTEHASWNSAQFGVCTTAPRWIRMSWKTFGTWTYWVTTSCVQYHGNQVTGGRYSWLEGRDARVY
ncbi:hypothetical protein HOY80DRAFT_981608 [Tuber brumale]|nr:hypothetical protein HOY80DRAFT_981608 [Tuber brumale]